MCALSQDLESGRWTHPQLVNLLTRMLSVENRLTKETREGIGRGLLGFVTAEANELHNEYGQGIRDGGLQRNAEGDATAVSDGEEGTEVDSKEETKQQSDTNKHANAHVAQTERQNGITSPREEASTSTKISDRSKHFCRCRRCWWRPEWVERLVLRDLLFSAAADSAQSSPVRGSIARDEGG